MAKTFDNLKDSARVENYLTGDFKTPKKAEQAVAADPDLQMPKMIKR